MFTGQYIFNIV